MRQTWIILGPTATGKSRLALQLALDMDCEIVNADALQVYRRLNLGTAKPAREDQELVPHHLLDILDPDETFSAGEFVRRAHLTIGDILDRGRRPLIVGGSGLYLRALMRGLSPIPSIRGGVRRQLRARLKREGLASLRRELRELDPRSEERLAEGDTQRVLRALEVVRATGTPLSSWLEKRPWGKDRLPSRLIGLTLPRALLYDRIEERVGAMVAAGWVEEVAGLLASGFTGSEAAFQAIGYRQIVRHLKENWPLEEAMADLVRATRRYAKRQMTWFRREPDITWFPALPLDGLLDAVRRTLLEGE
jgi:tRNA dimethylallyltransferase